MDYKLSLPQPKSDSGIQILSDTVKPFYKFKPIFMFTGAGVTQDDVSIQKEALNKVLSVANVHDVLPVRYFGRWYQSDEPYRSIDWYIRESYNSKRKQYNASRILELFSSEPWQSELHYEILILANEDLFTSQQYDLRFVIGASQGGFGTVLSLQRYKDSGKEVKKQAGIHEYGHTFLGLHHDQNICSMRFPNYIPDDLITHARDRLRNNAFCKKCENDGKNFVWEESEVLKHIPQLYEIFDKIRSKEPETLQRIVTGELAKITVEIAYV